MKTIRTSQVSSLLVFLFQFCSVEKLISKLAKERNIIGCLKLAHFWSRYYISSKEKSVRLDTFSYSNYLPSFFNFKRKTSSPSHTSSFSLPALHTLSIYSQCQWSSWLIVTTTRRIKRFSEKNAVCKQLISN